MKELEHYMKDIAVANTLLNDWCGTEGVDYYKGEYALSNLFRYAVPKAIEIEDGRSIDFRSPDTHRDFPSDYWLCRIEGCFSSMFGGWIAQEKGETPARALFWAVFRMKVNAIGDKGVALIDGKETLVCRKADMDRLNGVKDE